MARNPVERSVTPTPPPAPAPKPARKRSAFVDFYNGAVHGDYAPELGLPGITAQVICGFLPGIGTLCALRDFFACKRFHDGLGMALNSLSLVPFLGGVPKVAEVARSVRLATEGLHAVHTVHHSLITRQRPAAVAASATAAAPAEHRSNPAAVFSLLIGLFIPIVTPMLAVGFLQWVAPALRANYAQQLVVVALIGLVVPLLAILAGHAGRHRARGRVGYGSGRGMAGVGLALGYLYLFAFAAIAGIFYAIARPNFSHLFG